MGMGMEVGGARVEACSSLVERRGVVVVVSAKRWLPELAWDEEKEGKVRYGARSGKAMEEEGARGESKRWPSK